MPDMHSCVCRHGADPRQACLSDGSYPLFISAAFGKHEVVTALLKVRPLGWHMNS